MPDFAVLLRCFAFVHACLFSFVRKKETACDALRFYSAGSRSPFVRSRGVGAVICLGWFTSGLCVFLWRSRRVTGDAGSGGYGERGYGVGGAALVRLCAIASALQCFPRGVRWGSAPQTAPKSLRLSGLSSRCGGVMSVQICGLCAFLRNHIGLAAFSAGSTLGLRAPNLRQRVFDSLDSPHAAAGLCWRKHTSLQKAPTPKPPHPRLQSPGTRKDPPGSNLGPGGSGCIKM